MAALGIRLRSLLKFSLVGVTAYWRFPIFRDDLGLLFGGKNADRILNLLVREIKLSEDAIWRHTEALQRLNLGSEVLIVS